MQKKAQLGTLQAVIIALMIIGIVLGVGFMVLEEFEDTLATDTGTIRNETIAPTDAGIFVMYNYTTNGTIPCYHSFNPLLVYNVSDGILVTSGNYSYEATTGKFWNLTNDVVDGLGGHDWNVTYTYGYGGLSCAGVEETINATQKIPTWLPIIVILLIVGVILAIVFRVLPSAGAGEQAGGGSGFGGRAESGTTAEI